MPVKPRFGEGGRGKHKRGSSSGVISQSAESPRLGAVLRPVTGVAAISFDESRGVDVLSRPQVWLWDVDEDVHFSEVWLGGLPCCASLTDDDWGKCSLGDAKSLGALLSRFSFPEVRRG